MRGPLNPSPVKFRSIDCNKEAAVVQGGVPGSGFRVPGSGFQSPTSANCGLSTADFDNGGHTGMHLHVLTCQLRTSNFVLPTTINPPAASRLGAVRQINASTNQPSTNTNSKAKAKLFIANCSLFIEKICLPLLPTATIHCHLKFILL